MVFNRLLKAAYKDQSTTILYGILYLWAITEKVSLCISGAGAQMEWRSWTPVSPSFFHILLHILTTLLILLPGKKVSGDCRK